MYSISKGGSISDPAGFRAAAVWAGFKRKRLDLCMIVSDTDAVTSVKFTKNQLKAAPLLLALENRKQGHRALRAIVVNSGNANAGTGAKGYDNALRTASYTAEKLGLDPSRVLVSSTGIIGEQLDMKKMLSGLDQCIEKLPENDGKGCAEAILTTDTVEKAFSMSLEIDEKEIHFSGITKGSGMIAPNMATTLAFVTTDLHISESLLDEIFTEAVNKSYNRITVDGHMSTNDTALIISNGKAENREIIRKSSEHELLQNALNDLMLQMAISVVRDGEGASKFVSVTVRGSENDIAAEKIAFAVSNSALVKTAIFGKDPNWGRIVSAAAMTDHLFDPGHTELIINGMLIYSGGEPISNHINELKKIMEPRDIHIVLQSNTGQGEACVYTSDLSYEYVRINAEYHT